ncbi:MAG TPA: long-chain fatty acid--CoA ligase [Acidimicrobiales bacterium]|jgi:fatty-acyl-CoA synthase
MDGLMQDVPLTLCHAFERCERLFGAKTVTTATAAGVERTTYADWAARTRRLGGVLDLLELSADARVGTFGWNSAHHLELYFAAPCSGRVLHTLNIRLFAEQLVYIANHAEDEVVFCDRTLLPALWELIDEMKTVRHVVVMDDSGGGDLPPVPDDPRIQDYEALLAQAPPAEWRITDENRAAAMCYTSGTTGNPKGVVYSHRSSLLHAIGVLTSDGAALSERDIVMPVVPMFHANAWGLAHAGVLCGAAQVMPGPDLSPAAIGRLITTERVTVAGGVPTIWMGMLPLVDAGDVDLASVRTLLCGGSAVPRALMEGYHRHGVWISHAWGMTETSPVASMSHIKASLEPVSEETEIELRLTQGLPSPLVETRIVEPGGITELPWDGEATGELQVRGPWIARDYYRLEGSSDSPSTSDGWLKTGDVAAIDSEGYIRLVDRTKDLVKSGGEWISSVELENAIMGHPAVTEAAVVGVPHPKWDERPLACVVLAPGATLDREELHEFLSDKVAKWWLPDDVVIIDAVPRTSVGKFDKKVLRERFKDHALPT